MKYCQNNTSDDSDDFLTLKLVASKNELEHDLKINGALTEIFDPPTISNPEPQLEFACQVVSEVVSQVVGEVVNEPKAMIQPQKVEPEPLKKETPVTNPLATLPPLGTTINSAAEGLPTKESPSAAPQLKQKQPFHRRLQPVEILTSAGDWVAGYFVHQCIAVANLIGIEQKFTLFDADGETYSFLGQVRPL